LFGKVYSATIFGIDGVVVAVEADICNGLPSFDMVGILSSEVKEAKERVRTALKNSGFLIPPKRITVNLSPAALRKVGAGFDFPIAVAVLCAMEVIPAEALKGTMLYGELSLDGRLCGVPGCLPVAFAARERGLTRILVPEENQGEAAAVAGIAAVGIRSLEEAVRWFLNPESLAQRAPCKLSSKGVETEWDFKDVLGQKEARRAAEIAAAGMHNLLCIGSPGTGKTMVAKRLPGILPEMDMEEKLEVTRIYSVCGLLKNGNTLVQSRPFRSPHHTISPASLIGGGKFPKPGEVTLAHRGVLFLDELPEFSRSALESLRQPLEDREIVVARVSGACRFPADFLFCAAMNPCGCGYYPDRSRCHCSMNQISRYRGRISRPLLDRVDLIAEVPRISYEEWRTDKPQESSSRIRKRVEAARQRQKLRFDGLPIRFNSQMPGNLTKQVCHLGREEARFMHQVFETMALSLRAYDRVLKVARTIADLDGAENIQTDHLGEAVFYRNTAEKYWGDWV